MKKQPDRTARTRRKLIDSFWKFYEEKPIDKITIKEITDCAGVYRSTFYQYFSDIYDVLAAVEEEMEYSYDAFLRQASNASSVSATKEIILDFYCTNGKFLALLLGPHGDPQFLSAAKVRVKKTLKSILNIPSCDFETEIFIEMASSAIISMLTYWYDNQESVSLHQVIGTGSRFLQRGLIPYFRQRDMNFSHIDFGE
ncbi:MAG: TetR/AcrR family transcriptional regulator [Firmicutes bacterium]|nr:TetR/AcrR family transcriptional regulator [Bacillota bacterium]